PKPTSSWNSPQTFSFTTDSKNADLREDPDGQDHHPRGGVFRHHRQCQVQDPGQGGYPPRPTAPDLRRKAARGRPNPLRLQHPEGVYPPPGPPSPWWYHRALAQGSRLQVQLRQDDLPQVLRPSSSPCHQLPQAQVRPHQPASTQEEAQVNDSSQHVPSLRRLWFGVLS
ncbi:hypothetical protein K445DRAFT_337106, partial [Daldinia sp. EC12]